MVSRKPPPKKAAKKTAKKTAKKPSKKPVGSKSSRVAKKPVAKKSPAKKARSTPRKSTSSTSVPRSVPHSTPSIPTFSRDVDIVFTFDTTGSMYPCLTQVRRVIDTTTKRLFREIPNIRIGIIAHGDYCDEGRPYVTKSLSLTRDEREVTNFINKVESTGGGDYPECYELVLHEARHLNWDSNRQRILVMFGDAVPHEASNHQNKLRLDWKHEISALHDAGVTIFSVQCLNNPDSDYFWASLAAKSNGMHLTLDQFSNAPDIMTAICFKQAGADKLQNFERELVSSGRMNRNMDMAFAVLRGIAPAYDPEALTPRSYSARVRRSTATRGSYRSSRFKEVPKGLTPVPEGRFQVLDVDEDTPIRDFTEDNGLKFQPGRGFYQFTKRVLVQDYKEVILMDNVTGDFFYGSDARKLLGLPLVGSVHINPRDSSCDGYTAFIQSTSNNRKLMGGTKFLYEVEDSHATSLV